MQMAMGKHVTEISYRKKETQLIQIFEAMYKDATDAVSSKASTRSAAGLRVNCRGQRRRVNNYKQFASAFVNKRRTSLRS